MSLKLACLRRGALLDNKELRRDFVDALWRSSLARVKELRLRRKRKYADRVEDNKLQIEMLIGGQQTTFNISRVSANAFMAKPACELVVSNQQLSPSDKVETACSMVREAIKNNRRIFEQICAENVELFKRTMDGCLEVHKNELFDFRAKDEQVLKDSRAHFNQELKREVDQSSRLQSYFFHKFSELEQVHLAVRRIASFLDPLIDHGTVNQLLQTFNNQHYRLNKLEQQFQPTSERPQTSTSSRQKTKVPVQDTGEGSSSEHQKVAETTQGKLLLPRKP
ncbi:hypothetical protein PInf_026416 [Phytophthora infestans]|nr:hypothetical protein PInf_026416 [Phytophthora infestans]